MMITFRKQIGEKIPKSIQNEFTDVAPAEYCGWRFELTRRALVDGHDESVSTFGT
jgi:hypothetical protein